LTNHGPVTILTATATNLGITSNPTSFFGATNVSMTYT
jgi:hypothetical protein